MNDDRDQAIIPFGKIEAELVKSSNSIRPFKDGETVIPFGRYVGYTMEHINVFDHSYIVFLTTLRGGPKIQFIIDKAMEMTTLEERNAKKENKKYYSKKCQEAKWLTDFLLEVSQSGCSWSKFAYSILRKFWNQHRLDLISTKQITCLANMWGEVHSGKKEGTIFNKAREEFKDKMKPYWKRKYERIEDL